MTINEEILKETASAMQNELFQVASNDNGQDFNTRLNNQYSVIEKHLLSALRRQAEGILKGLPKENNELFGLPVIVSEVSNSSDDYTAGFKYGFNTCLSLVRESIEKLTK